MVTCRLLPNRVTSDFLSSSLGQGQNPDREREREAVVEGEQVRREDKDGPSDGGGGGNERVLHAFRNDRRAKRTIIVIAHRMLIFSDDGPSTVEQLIEEGERRKLIRKRRIELLGEERAKELEEEDYEREEVLLDLMEDEENPEPEEPDIEFCELPSKQQKAYRKRLRKSTGFDVGDIPDNVVGIPVRPYKLDTHDSLEIIGGFSKLALDQHNKDNGTKYQLVKVLKANIGDILGGKRGRTYYITFQVKDMAGSGSPTLNLQAVVKTLKGQATVTYSAPEPLGGDFTFRGMFMGAVKFILMAFGNVMLTVFIMLGLMLGILPGSVLDQLCWTAPSHWRGLEDTQSGGTLGRTYFITFQVKNRACSGSPILNFRAKVRTFKGQATVTFSAPEL
ncbi:hypothetical protein RHGRI_028190 [Rhododendron griersonianum]|uniref:Uncharacterized protein n=1 Tax=Rhododendron griersonianum TaxID=479676 RepID=A0AAV6IKF3_9ERIC|nr:hypothetical protein RHGRI_028190 [Rhododendron griersonianum]